MKYMLRTDGSECEVAKTAVAKMNPNGVQKVDPITGWPVWGLQIAIWSSEEDGAEVLSVNVPAPTMPTLRWREPVEVVDLEMIPWSQKGRDGDIRSGVAFRAKEIRPVSA